MLTIALLTATLALTPAAGAKRFDFAPNLDQESVLPDMALEAAQKVRDIAPIVPSARNEFSNLAPLRGGVSGAWVVRAGWSSAM